ncbi:MAG: helix-turn-helix domain-containing protein [Candidatus Didemnitutus sp.]|nr:helix-turn-helix domain-containing protein [Candidatus Didemnitutus sp.]
MQTLGERLEEARKRKGISIREAAEATKIRGDYLQKFEANTFGVDLPPLYIRGFVRNYARFLELDPARFLAEYDSLIAGERSAPRRDTRENYGRVEFGGDSAEADSPAPTTTGGLDPVMLKNLLLGGGAVVLILIIVLVINSLTSSSDTRGASKEAAKDAAPAHSSVAAQNLTAQTVTFTALDRTRIKIVRDDDKSIIYDGTFARGETRSIRKTGVLLVTVEDRTRLRMEVNGRSMDIPLFETGNYGRFKLD